MPPAVKNSISLISSIWPIIVSIVIAIAGYATLTARVSALELGEERIEMDADQQQKQIIDQDRRLIRIETKLDLVLEKIK